MLMFLTRPSFDTFLPKICKPMRQKQNVKQIPSAESWSMISVPDWVFDLLFPRCTGTAKSAEIRVRFSAAVTVVSQYATARVAAVNSEDGQTGRVAPEREKL